MAELTFNTKPTKRVPINRNNLFYSEESFLLEEEIGRNYIEQDCNQNVVLYQVDLEKTNLDSTYKEARSNGVVFKTPIELHVLYTLEKAELKSYEKSKNLGTYVKGGKLSFGVYQFTLDEMGADIKNGDYVGVQVTPTHMEYYTVVNDGRNNFSNEETMYGYKPFYRNVECAQVDINEFDGK